MINTYRVKLAFSSFFLMLNLVASAQTSKLQEDKELELVNFNSVKKVLQKDGLSESAFQKKQQVAILKKEQINLDHLRYNYPPEDEMWGFISEYWLVKNAPILGWDFEKPDYGLDYSFKTTLQKMGFVQKKFKILLINNPVMVRAALPGSNGDIILLMSVPFIRSLDLSKLEISLLFLEDYLRLEAGYFKNNVGTQKLKNLAGTSFQGAKPDMSMLEELLKNYTNQINSKGYTFQQQFETTKKMDVFLKSQPELWNVYFHLLQKLNNYFKANVQYKDYVKLYPSPEMQIKWISPDEKVL